MTFSDFLRDVYDNKTTSLTFTEWLKTLEPTTWIEYGDKFAELEREFISDDYELATD